jgi:hypothetical protein
MTRNKDTTESEISASYLDILLGFYSNGGLASVLYDRRNDFDFAIVKFPFLCSNNIMPLSPAYDVYISQLIRYTGACFEYEDFSKRGTLLKNKLIFQGYNESRLNLSNHFANSTVDIMALFAITNYHWPIC